MTKNTLRAVTRLFEGIDTLLAPTVGEKADLSSEELKEIRIQVLELLSHIKCPKQLLPLSIAIDERVEKRLDIERRNEWRSLHEELFGYRNGAQFFFSKLGGLLQKRCVDDEVLTTYLFCIEQGFKGSLYKSPELVQDYVRRIRDYVGREQATLKSQGGYQKPMAGFAGMFSLVYFLAWVM